jgi:hypothetical protein
MEDQELYPEWTRKIVERRNLDEVSDELTLECGHVTVLVCPPPPWVEYMEYMECAQCLHAWMDEEKAKRT